LLRSGDGDEIVVRGGGGDMHARITTITGSVEGAKEARQALTEQVLPSLRNIPQLKKGYLLTDDATGKTVGVFLYETEDDLVASREAATRLREESARNIGGTIESVEEFEVVGEI
jgi:hypothetical protein